MRRELGLVNGLRIERYSLCVMAQKKATEPTTPACSMKDITPVEQKQQPTQTEDILNSILPPR